MRTIFNLLGPLTNPAGAPRQLLGVSDAAYLERMGQALAELGCERAMLVRGRDGMDELSTAAVTDVVHVDGLEIGASTVDPAELGFAPPRDGDIAGSDPAGNAAVLRSVLEGARGPPRRGRPQRRRRPVAGRRRAGPRAGRDRGRRQRRRGAARARLDAFIA